MANGRTDNDLRGRTRRAGLYDPALKDEPSAERPGYTNYLGSFATKDILLHRQERQDRIDLFRTFTDIELRNAYMHATEYCDYAHPSEARERLDLLMDEIERRTGQEIA